ncbi:MAG: hypothetical protein Q8Q14_05195 [Gemmatimonadales bacterium]|nr:hypothetical protein [Gemmatimonadales bacterium]
MSSASSVNDALTGYAAGRVTAEQLVRAVAGVYYREQGAGSREQLKPLMEVIERAHPGIVRLTAAADRPGFAIELTERPFPKQYEDALRSAVQTAVAQGGVPAPSSLLPAPSLLARLYVAVRKFFSA